MTSIRKASKPELVDVKVTNYCDYGCSFCYQGSTVRGAHAPFERLALLKDALSRLCVWEVALGGGEPTQFKSGSTKGSPLPFLLHWGDITASLTTRNLTVLDYLDEVYKKYKDAKHSYEKDEWRRFGAVAFSVETVADAEKVHEKYLSTEMSKDWGTRHKISYQYIVGVNHDSELAALLKWAKKTNSRLTLLGFKHTGRGEAYATKGLYSGKVSWLPLVLESAPAGLGIDTALAQEYRAEIEESGISRKLVTYTEGSFSCYIDAVEWEMGPSSYCQKREMVQLPPPWEPGKWSDNLSSQEMIAAVGVLTMDREEYTTRLAGFIQKTFSSWAPEAKSNEQAY